MNFINYNIQSSLHKKKHKNSKQYRSSDNNQSNSRNTNFNNNDVEYCIPTETVEILNLKNTNETVKIDNPNIFFNRCMSKNTTSKCANKQGHLRNMNNICHSKYLTEMISNLINRQDKIINNLKNSGYCVKSFKMKNDYRIVIGLGGAHVLETNMLLHHIYGIPHIPGSALKGLAKAAAVENIREYINSNDLTESIKQKNESLLKKLFKTKKIRVPCKSTFHRILSNVSYDGLEVVFRDFFSKYAKGKNIAIDGKWLNGSDVKGQYLESSHKSVLHIFDKDSKIALGHKFMEKSKLSEIPAFNEILKDKTFSNAGQIYTMDALHTQTETLNYINENDEYFLAKVKGNQKALLSQFF